MAFVSQAHISFRPLTRSHAVSSLEILTAWKPAIYCCPQSPATHQATCTVFLERAGAGRSGQKHGHVGAWHVGVTLQHIL